MKIPTFATEEFFSHYEFGSPHLLGVSDCETMSIDELLSLAGLSSSDLAELRLGYTESAGHPDLRRAIAATYADVEPDDVVVLTSPVEGIYLTMRTLLSPGDRALVLSPAYDALFNLAEHVCGGAERWALEPDEGGWRLDLAALARWLEQTRSATRRLVVVNFPHNPTGFQPTQAEFERLVAMVEGGGAWLFCDEMYRGAEFGRAEQLPSATDLCERSVVLGGLSKSYGLPGLRCGWLVIRREDLRAELINWKHYTSICPPAPTEFLAMAALSARGNLLARSRATIAANVGLATEFFRRRPGLFEWRPPQAGSVALVGIDVPSASAYCHDLARRAGIVLLPGTCLGYDDRHVRFGFGRASFREALEHYDRHLGSTV